MAYSLKFPPRCIRCGEKLQEQPNGPGYLPCTTCPPGSRVVYYLQVARDGYPEGWPLCTWCGSPVRDGQATCGNLICKVKEREKGMKGG